LSYITQKPPDHHFPKPVSAFAIPHPTMLSLSCSRRVSLYFPAPCRRQTRVALGSPLAKLRGGRTGRLATPCHLQRARNTVDAVAERAEASSGRESADSDSGGKDGAAAAAAAAPAAGPLPSTPVPVTFEVCVVGCVGCQRVACPAIRSSAAKPREQQCCSPRAANMPHTFAANNIRRPTAPRSRAHPPRAGSCGCWSRRRRGTSTSWCSPRRRRRPFPSCCTPPRRGGATAPWCSAEWSTAAACLCCR